ncbi:MAG: hypothetical protein ACK53L_31125, partial [Pirellulaceae bacterium]
GYPTLEAGKTKPRLGRKQTHREQVLSCRQGAGTHAVADSMVRPLPPSAKSGWRVPRGEPTATRQLRTADQRLERLPENIAYPFSQRG